MYITYVICKYTYVTTITWIWGRKWWETLTPVSGEWEGRQHHRRLIDNQYAHYWQLCHSNYFLTDGFLCAQYLSCDTNEDEHVVFRCWHYIGHQRALRGLQHAWLKLCCQGESSQDMPLYIRQSADRRHTSKIFLSFNSICRSERKIWSLDLKMVHNVHSVWAEILQVNTSGDSHEWLCSTAGAWDHFHVLITATVGHNVTFGENTDPPDEKW